MLTVYIQSESARREIEKKIAAAREKESEVVTITDANFSPELTSSYFGANDLFGKEHLVFLDRIFANSEARSFFWDNISQFADTLNEFVLLEEKILADDVRIIEKAGGEVVKGEKSVTKQKPEFNIFALADALGNRDKKNLWVLYVTALREGKSPEEISGTLFWQLKSMLTLQKGGGKSLSPFVKTKSARYLKNYAPEELEKITYDFVSNYHLSRRGGLPLAERLEKLILSL